MQHKRIVMTLAVIVSIVLLVAILMLAGPSLMNAVLTMHSR